MGKKVVLGIPLKKITLIITLITLFTPLFLFGRDIKVIESSGLAAIINAGKSQGIKKGELLSIRRFQDGQWIEITFAEVTHSRRKMARIQVADGAPLMALRVNDTVFPIDWTKKTSEQAAKVRNGKASVSTIRFLSLQDQEGMYIGPMVNYFIPIGDMRDVYEEQIGYGGILGSRLRADWDITVRFYAVSNPQRWSIWDIQLMGRKYWDRTFLVDFGYGLTYRAMLTNDFYSLFGGAGNIKLGFLIGCGFSLPLSVNSSMEFGGLYHYYPDFGGRPASFFTVGGRLCL